MLPPDVVCLYSEDRKFFLHGALYCALAAGDRRRQERGADRPRAGKGLSLRQDPRSAEAAYRPPLRRSGAARVGGRADAYWASLGLSPADANANLQNCRVRIESIDVQGAKELGAALKALGVRVVRGAADLTVTLVSDYLEARLAELNRRHLSDRTRWLLVQPSGIFPLVGPVFSPGKTEQGSGQEARACWTCLAERMNRNREVKAFLDRKQARRVAASPLARDPFGQSAIDLASTEIAKAIATGFRTDLNDHIVSLDLLGSTIARHYVAARPQCPACGRKALRDPRRAPAPVELGGGGKLVMTSGGYRSVSSRATVARFRKHVSPLTGVVSRLERIDADLPMNTNYFATHNFSARPETVDELKAGLSGGSFGKGATAEQGEASGLMEAIERYSGIFQGDEIRARRRFTDFAPGDAISPNDVLLYSDAQARGVPRRRAARTRRRRWRSIRSIGRDRMVAGLVAARPAVQISSDQPAVFLLPRPRPLPGPRGFERLRGRQHPGRSHRPGLPRAGGTRCLRDLVVQSIAAGGSGPRPVRRSLHP